MTQIGIDAGQPTAGIMIVGHHDSSGVQEMQKSDLIEAVIQVGDLNIRQADDVIAIIIEQITNAMARGESVNLIGFGAFWVRPQASRTGRHPQTGEAITIPAMNRPHFKPGKKLKEAVAES